MEKMLSSFKKKFIKNTLIYQIYRYYKYKFKYFGSYGASGEDIFINKFFNNLKNGFFVDVGALHPVNGSLTYLLNLRGWKGINIDMIRENLTLFDIFRNKDINLDTAISSSTGLINAYLFEKGSGINTNSPKLAKFWKTKLKKNYEVRKVKANTLNNILQKYKISKNFEFLNIDVEGHELEVLKGLNLKKFRPKLIAIEIHVIRTKDIFVTKVYKHLTKANYELISQYNQTSFFSPKIKNSL